MYKIIRFVAVTFKLFAAYTVVLPLLALATFVNETCRLFVNLSLTSTKYKLMEFGLSNMFYLAGPDKGGLNLVLLISQDEVDIELERCRFRETLKQTNNGKQTFKRLTETLGCQHGYGCWKENGEDFDIRNHVKLYDLSKPGDCRDYYTHEEFMDTILPQVLKYMNNTDRPEWEWLIVQRVLMPEGFRTLRLFRFHHSYMDGVATGLFISQGIMDQPCNSLVIDFCKPPTAWESFLLLLSKIHAVLRVPYFVAETFLNAATNRRYLEKDPFLAVKSERKITMLYSSILPVENLRMLKKKYGSHASIHRILSTGVANALETLARQKGVQNGMMNLSLPLIVPYYSDAGPRNRLSFVKVHAPLGSDGSSERGSNRDLIEIPGSSDLLSAYFLLRWMDRFPRPGFNLMGKFQGGSFVSAMFNNLPFLRKAGRIHGSVIEEVMSWPHPKQPVGVLITALRYGDSIRFYSATDDSVFSRNDAKLLLDTFEDQLRLQEWDNGQ